MRLIQFSEHPSESEQSHTMTSSARTLRLGRLVYTFLGMISNRYELVVQDDVRVVVVVVVVVVAFVVETGSQEDLSARVGAWPRSFPGPANTRPGGGFVSVVIVICDPLGLRLGSARPPQKNRKRRGAADFFSLSLSLFPGREDQGYLACYSVSAGLERRPPLGNGRPRGCSLCLCRARPPPAEEIWRRIFDISKRENTEPRPHRQGWGRYVRWWWHRIAEK